MFKDFYEKFNFKKTTPEEKKEVVNNTGDWFPEEHENKIKGIEKVGEESMNKVYRNCKECGKVFVPRHHNCRYCSADCAKEAELRQARNYYERKKSGKVKKVGNKRGRTIRLTEDIFNEMKKMRNEGASLGYIADKFDFNTKTVSIAMSFDTYDEFNIKRRSMKEANTVNKKVEQPVEAEEDKPQFDSLDALKKAVEIVQVIKSEEDVKLAVDKTYELLKKYIAE